MNTENRQPRKIRSFVRREGRITPAQQRALQELWPRFGLETEGQLDLDACFVRSAPRTLEIGFGNGHALADMAESAPELDFVGIEVHDPGVGHCLLQLQKNHNGNVRLIRHDAIEVLEHQCPDQSLHGINLFFPDPWPKKRHHKRRIVQPDFIQLVAKKLKPGGILHMATDWEDYAEHMLVVMQAAEQFRNLAGTGHYSPRPDYRPVTKFEQRGKKLGHDIFEFAYRRT